MCEGLGGCAAENKIVAAAAGTYDVCVNERLEILPSNL
jgi:hypothetical protein